MPAKMARGATWCHFISFFFFTSKIMFIGSPVQKKKYSDILDPLELQYPYPEEMISTIRKT